MNKSIMTHFRIVLLVTCLSGCAALPEGLIKAPDVNLRDVQVMGLGFNSQSFLLSFDIANANSFSLPIRNVEYDVRLDGRRFASGETSSEFTIPANGRSSFAISVELDLLQTTPQLLSIVRNGARRDIAYELNGRLDVDIALVPTLTFRNSGTVHLNSGP